MKRNREAWNTKHIAISSFVSSVWFLIFKAGAKNCFECHVDVQDAYVSELKTTKIKFPFIRFHLRADVFSFVLDLKLIYAPSKSFASS